MVKWFMGKNYGKEMAFVYTTMEHSIKDSGVEARNTEKGTLMTVDHERIIYTGDWERGRSDHNNGNGNDSSHDNDSTMDGRVYYCGDFKESIAR
jgi:hypothetical protein